MKADLIKEPEYVQSSNSLFHFMKEERFLEQALKNRILFPRYCPEDISYFNIQKDHKTVKSISVLQKCFCDIPLHQITRPLSLMIIHDECRESSSIEGNETQQITHTAFYGEYGIAFSKQWGVSHNLQPVHYVNPESSFTRDIASAFEAMIDDDGINSSIVNDMINRLSFSKPLQGQMIRTVNRKKVYYSKVFHDEREWRFIPPVDALEEVGLERIIYKDYIQNDLNLINEGIATADYKTIGLSFDYEDIKYLVVPDNEARERLIDLLWAVLDSIHGEDNHRRKAILISKIIVLDEINKDF